MYNTFVRITDCSFVLCSYSGYQDHYFFHLQIIRV